MKLEDIAEQFRGKVFGYVYAIRCGKWLVKVGHAQDVKKRLSEIGMHNPFELIVENCLMVSFGKQAEVERRLHKILKSDRKHVRGEWFGATSGTINRCFNQMTREFEGAQFCDHLIGLKRFERVDQPNYKFKHRHPEQKAERDLLGADTVKGLFREHIDEVSS
jgi:hypothetical protein